MALYSAMKARTAIVTGASRGIGRAIAHQLARDGAQIVLCARDRNALDETVAAIEQAQGRAIAVALGSSAPNAIGYATSARLVSRPLLRSRIGSDRCASAGIPGPRRWCVRALRAAAWFRDTQDRGGSLSCPYPGFGRGSGCAGGLAEGTVRRRLRAVRATRRQRPTPGPSPACQGCPSLRH